MKKYSGSIFIALLALLSVAFFLYDGNTAEKNPAQQAPANPAVEKPVQSQEAKPSPSVTERIKNAAAPIVAALKRRPENFSPSPEINVEIRGDMRVEVIDEKTICVVGSYEKFLKERFSAECGDFLKSADGPGIPQWSKNLFYNVLGAKIILKYRPVIAEAFNNGMDFKLSGGAEVAQAGYWVNPAGQAAFTNASDGSDKLTRNAFVNHYAFLKLKEPMQNGKKYEVEIPLGQKAEFTYDDSKNTSAAIKTNQLGYSPKAGRKYAYIGSWLGTMGALDLSRLENSDFFIIEEPSGRSAYSGKIHRRGAESFYKGAAFTGEDVYEMDFSDFADEGFFRMFVPGVGNSPPFKVSNDAVGEAFFIHAKGVYHKRCGTPKEAPFTNWVMGECHMKTFASDFPPNNKHYGTSAKRLDCGFYDEEGKQVGVNHFTLIAARKTSRALDLNGGWHDAADYDRRPYHYDVVGDLLSAYLFRPDNFTDGQLNIPESSNGVPDIVDEAAWGMEIWRKAQDEIGSVPGWIEATSHPQNYNPSTDEQAYYLSASTMESTMQYAAYASMLALAYKNAGKAELSQIWQDSATKAYHWASNPSHRFIKTYDYPVETRTGNKTVTTFKKLTYKEAAQVPAEFVFKTAFNLWLLTKDETFLAKCKSLEKDMPQMFAETSWRINPLMFSEFLKYGGNAEGLSKTFSSFKKTMIGYADERLNWLNNAYPYRIPWYPADHPYVTHMSWGIFHPLNRAKFFMNAHELTKDKKYRDAAHLCNDWHNGANPTGLTMTSGLGKIYPVRFLDLISYSDGIAEYVQGITPYRNTFGIARDDVALAHALMYKPMKDRDFDPKPTMLLPKSVIGSGLDVNEVSRNLEQAWPVWRRFANVEAYSVAASEYTVSETIAPAAALTGWLLEPGYKPSEELKNRKPADDVTKLGGYAPLP